MIVATEIRGKKRTAGSRNGCAGCLSWRCLVISWIATWAVDPAFGATMMSFMLCEHAVMVAYTTVISRALC